MIRIPGGTFRMGSDKHYPEEAPSLASAEGLANAVSIAKHTSRLRMSSS